MIPWVLDLILKATVVLIVVGAVVRLGHGASAATRHFLWACGLAALLLLPVVALSVPGWSPGWVNDWAPEYLAARGTPLDVLTVPSWLGEAGWRRDRRAGDAVDETSAVDAAPEGASPATADGVTIEATTPPPDDTLAPRLLTIWLTGALLMASRLAVGLARRARLSRRASSPVARSVSEACDDAAGTLDLRRRIRLVVGDDQLVPMTWGFARPVLYLPTAARRWEPLRLRTVLMHELAHIKRHDSLSRLLAQLTCSCFWFHPLAWAAARAMLREQEKACDDVVIEHGADPHAYAETLLEVAREFRSPRAGVVGALAFSRVSNLEHRLLSILDPLARRKNMSMIRMAIVATLFAATVVPLAALRPAAAAPEEAPQERLSITQEGAGEQVLLEAEGMRRIPARIDDIDLEPGGRLTIAEGDRRLEARRPEEGELTFTYTVDGVDQPFDASARRWADDLLDRFDELRSLDDLEASLAQIEIALEPLDLEPLANLEQLERSLTGLRALEVALPKLEPLELFPVSLQPVEIHIPALSVARLPARGMYEFDSIRSWTDEGTRVVVMRRGDARIGATIDDITVGDDGDLVIDERGADGHRRLHVYAGADGELVFDYARDGESAPFDDAARAWLQPIIERLR